MVPFECDLCVFRKLRGNSPRHDNATDSLLLSLIRRANLDAFWSSTTGTVEKHANRLRAGIKFSRNLGLLSPYYQVGHLPTHDHCGYQVACQMLLHSLNEGRINKNYTQFDTIRKLRAAFSNQVRASNQANIRNIAVNDNKGVYQRIGADVCGSFWFSRFISGCQNRMGQETRKNKALSTPLLMSVFDRMESKIKASESLEEHHRWSVFVCYAAVSYTISLRGNEGFLLDLEGLIRYKNEVAREYFIIALLGKIKGETNDKAHLIPCINETSSGIKVKRLVDRLVDQKSKLGIKDGPVITNIEGKLYRTRDIDDMLHEVLIELFAERREHFPTEITSKVPKGEDSQEYIKRWYSCFRTFRRSSYSRAFNSTIKLRKDDIDVVNRWRGVETAKGKRPQRSMKQNDADVEVLPQPFLRYTRAM